MRCSYSGEGVTTVGVHTVEEVLPQVFTQYTGGPQGTKRRFHLPRQNVRHENEAKHTLPPSQCHHSLGSTPSTIRRPLEGRAGLEQWAEGGVTAREQWAEEGVTARVVNSA